MIKYDPKTNVLTMDLTDLEHCGFDHDEFKAALFLAGIDDTIVPEKLVVNFSASVVILDDIWRLWSYVVDDVINEADVNPCFEDSVRRVYNWLSEQYCTCQISMPYAVSTGELRCKVCGKLIKYVTSNTDATGG